MPRPSHDNIAAGDIIQGIHNTTVVLVIAAPATTTGAWLIRLFTPA
ncbi:MAG: hypothetical protein Q4B08_13680 [Propionibacteriaceae bacterium]|nr:hypothetical protein [Propionibacteriaceae bacterium]